MKQIYISIRTGQFIIYSIIIYLCLTIFWGQFLPESFNKNNPNAYEFKRHNKLRLDQVKELKNIDLLFLGSSHSYKNFDPRFFYNDSTKTIFNLGSNAQTPIQTEILLKRYLKNLNPRKIIYEMNPDEFIAEGTESTIDIIKSDILDFDIAKLAICQMNLKSINALIHSIIPNKNEYNPEDFRTVNDQYIEGYIETKNKFYNGNLIFCKDKTSTLKSFQIEAFIRNINLIKTLGIEFIIIQAPMTKAKYGGFTCEHYFDSIMYSNGKYINYNRKKLPLIDTLNFMDHHHLNKSGVEIFNKQVKLDLNL